MGLKQNLATEPVGKLDLRRPVLCKPNDSLRSAVEAMRAAKLGCVLVVDDETKPVGIFTESMLVQLLVNDRGAVEETVSEHMSTDCPVVRQNDVVAKVLEAMESKNARFLAVLDDDGRVVGLTGQKGLMEFVSEHFPHQVMVQRVGSPPPKDREGA